MRSTVAPERDVDDDQLYGDERVRALRRRALLAERLLVDLGAAADRDIAAGLLVQALTAVAGSSTAELLLRPAGHEPTGDGEDPAVVLARSDAQTVPGDDDGPSRHRVVDVAHGLELIVHGDSLPPVAIDRSLAALGTILDRIDTEQRLLREARTDVLTGLLNRRAIDERLAAELSRVERSDEALSLLVLDLDGFKEINDAHGHAAGDELLRTVADTMTRVARVADDAGRLGGDEFALILPATGRDGAEAAATRLHEELAELGDGVSASIGIATVDGGAVPTVTELLSRADAAMYAAKRTADRAIVHADPDGRR